jgi:hypothetical protein
MQLHHLIARAITDFCAEDIHVLKNRIIAPLLQNISALKQIQLQ